MIEANHRDAFEALELCRCQSVMARDQFSVSVDDKRADETECLDALGYFLNLVGSVVRGLLPYSVSSVGET
jgi:hypothetical protein